MQGSFQLMPNFNIFRTNFYKEQPQRMKHIFLYNAANVLTEFNIREGLLTRCVYADFLLEGSVK